MLEDKRGGLGTAIISGFQTTDLDLKIIVPSHLNWNLVSVTKFSPPFLLRIVYLEGSYAIRNTQYVDVAKN